MENNQENKKKLSLDDFKVKSNQSDSQESLDAITGGVLSACHDGSSGPIKCTGSYSNDQ